MGLGSFQPFLAPPKLPPHNFRFHAVYKEAQSNRKLEITWEVAGTLLFHSQHF